MDSPLRGCIYAGRQACADLKLAVMNVVLAHIVQQVTSHGGKTLVLSTVEVLHANSSAYIARSLAGQLLLMLAVLRQPKVPARPLFQRR